MDRPILFSGPMVRALLANSKMQTRRVLKPQPAWDADVKRVILDGLIWPIGSMGQQCGPPVRLPWVSVGDRLWVRETWRVTKALDTVRPQDLDRTTIPEWLATDPALYEGKLRPGMFLPRWASRLTLIVIDVRVQRLQDISEADARAEGVECWSEPGMASWRIAGELSFKSAADAYRLLWNKLNDRRGYGWATNPWVVAVTFTVRAQNIDRMGEEAHG